MRIRGKAWGGVLCGLLGCTAVGACGDDGPPGGGDGGSAGADASAGGKPSSGGKGSTGGRPPGTGGTGGMGTGGAGAPTGGTTSSGGAGGADAGGTTETGGASPAGGTPSTGGTSPSSGGTPTEDGGPPDGSAGDADVPCGEVDAPCCASQACASDACCNAVSGLCVAASGTCVRATCGGSGCTFCTGARFFGNPVSAPSPRVVTAADLDGDGDNDLVVSSTDGFAVLLNDGKGEFTRTDYPFDTPLTNVGVGDVDGDGTADLVFSAPSVNEIVVFLDAGGGTFGGAARYAAGPLDHGFVVDADLDGHLDVVINTNEGLKVLENDGSGAFGSATVLFATPLDVPDLLDLNGDGRMDVVGVVKGDGPEPFAAYLNLPGGFTRSYDYTLPSDSYRSIVPGDYDGDGDTDFVFGNIHGWALLLNDRDGTFTASVLTLNQGGDWPRAFNVDGDADSDVLVQEVYGKAWVYESVGGVLAPPRAFYPGVIDAVAELNGDGKTDLIRFVNDGITVGLSRSDGTYPGFSLASSHETSSFPLGILAGDLNGDGLTDALAPYDSSGLYVSLGTSTGKLAPPVLYTVSRLTPTSGVTMVLDDLTGDGAPDVALSAGYELDIRLLVNSGTGTFGTPSSITVGGVAMGIASGDVDSDGDADLVATVRTPTADSLALLKNDGAAHFAAPATLVYGDGARAVLLTDLNADGILDVAVSRTRPTDPYEGAVQVLLGTGGGNFAPPVEYRGGGLQVYAMAAGDVDNDGDIDLVVGGPDGEFGVDGFLSVLVNAGNRTFMDGVPFFFPSPPDTLQIADFNADGWNDLVAVVSWAGVAVHLNQRDGTFALSEAIPINAAGALVLDFDGDGRTDILTNAAEGVAVARSTAECRLR